MKPGYEAVDVIDRHPQPLPERAGEGDHVCALEHDGADLWILRDELVPGRENVLARCSDVERRLAMTRQNSRPPSAVREEVGDAG